MRILFKLALVFAFFSSFAYGQTTVTVTGQVLDPTGQIYANGNGRAVLVPQNVNWLVNNTNPVPTPITISGLDSFGRFSISVTRTDLVSPQTLGPQWQFSFCSQSVDFNPVCFTMTPMTISSSQDISVQIQAQSAPLPNTGSGGNLSSTGVFTPGHMVKIFDATHLQDLGVTGTGLGVLNISPTFTGTVSIAGLRLSAMTGLTSCLFVDTTGLVNGTGLACGAGGGGGPAGLTRQFQFNNAGTLAGTGAQNQASQTLYDLTTGKVSIPNLANARSTDSYSWSLLPATDLTSAGSKTITLTPCPLGIDVSNNANAPYAVYIATTGTPEVAFVTGGTCTGGAASGTITLVTVNTHANGYTVSSSNDGIQEAINDAGTPNATVTVPPSIGSSPTHIVRNTVYLNSNKMTLSMYGAHLSCQVRGPCIYVSDRSGATQFQKILGGRLAAGVNVDGIQITNTVAASGTYTITTNGSHPFLVGDYVYVEWYQANAYQHAVVQITATTSTTFTYILGSATTTSAASFGWAALEAAAIENNGEGVVIRDLGFTSVGFPNKFHFGIVVNNDQAATIDHINNEGSGAVFRCSSNFCGAMVYGRGDQNNANVIWVRNSEISLQCGGNGILALSGNSLHVSDTVVQGFNQYGIQYSGGLQEALISNVYEEVGNCNNPQYPGSLQGMAGVIGTGITIQGVAPIVGANPLFANTGANQRNYFIVPKSVGFGAGSALYAGSATTNNAGTVNIYWPQIVNDNAAGVVTYDVLLTTGATSPYLGNANSLATGISGSCANGICTFADTHAATSAYTVVLQTWFPHIYFWPGSYVGNVSTNRDSSFGLEVQFRLDNLSTTGQSGYVSSYGVRTPSAFVNECSPVAGTWSPSWISCQNAFANTTPNFAQLYEQITGSNSGPPVGAKGRVNYGPVAPNLPIHLQTLVDSAFYSKTLATPGSRPPADANDSYIGEDQAGGISYGAPTSLSSYIGNTGDNSAWLERLTATGKTVKVPFTVNDGGTAFNIRAQFGACSSPGDSSHIDVCADPSGDLAYNKKNTAIFRKVIPQDYTFSSGSGFPALPAASAVDTGQLAIITDAATSACPVTSGSGTQRVLVRSNGTTWDCVSGPGSAAIAIGLFSTLPGSPVNNQLAVVTDWTGTCPVTSGSGTQLHERMVIWNAGMSKWDCVPDGLLPLVTTAQAWDGLGNGGIHLTPSSTDTNASDQNSLHTNSLGTLLIFADSSGPPATLYALGMWPASSSLPSLGTTKCLSIDSSGHIIFNTFACSPLTALGDLYVGGASGTPSRLAIGGAGTAAVSNGTTLTNQAVATVTGTSDLTARTTSETTVTLATSPSTGLYALKYYADLNTACTTGGNTVSFTFSWTDATGARTLSTGSLSLAQNAPVGSSYLTGVIPLWVGSGNVTFTSTISGSCASGTSSYDRHMSLVKG